MKKRIIPIINAGLWLIFCVFAWVADPAFARAGESACLEISRYEKIHRARSSVETRQNLATLYNNCGIEYSHKKQWNTAERYLQKARSLDKKPLYNQSLASIIARRAHEAFESGNMRKAKEDYEKALRYDPKDSDLKIALSQVLYRLESSTENSHALLKEGASHSLGGSLWQKKVEQFGRETEFEKVSHEIKKGNWILRLQEGISEINTDQIFQWIHEISQEVGKDFNHWIKERLIFVLVSEEQFSKIHSGPGWSAALNDGRIKIPVTGRFKDPLALKAVLAHEYTHSVVNHYARTHRVPFWVHEGLAEYEERKIDGTLTLNTKNFPSLYEAHRKKIFIPMATLQDMEKAQALPPAQIALAYEQSASFVLFVKEIYYFHSLLSLLKEIGKGKPLEEAIARGIGRNLNYLEKEWHSWLDQQLQAS